MTATAHALVGGAIAVSVPDPVLGISLALISHPILDFIPHWDFGWGWRNKNKAFFLMEGLFDLAVGVGVSYFLFGQYTNLTYFLTVIFAALFLDFIQIPYWFLKWKFPPFSWIYKTQSKINSKASNFSIGIFNQVVAVVGIILVLRIFH